MFAIHFMNEHFYLNISIDIGNTVQVVNEYTLILVKSNFLMSITTQCIKNTSLLESIDDNFRLLTEKVSPMIL